MSYPGRQNIVRPEEAIKRAAELCRQGQQKLALQKLQDVFRLKRPKIWQEKHEEAMMKLAELSISMRRNLKDDLMSYRQFARDVTQPTVERVLFYVVQHAEQETDKVEGEKDAKAIEVCEAGEISDEAPESILMKAVSGEEQKDRLSREFLHPWLRYLIECYKACMDVCIKHPDFEDTFHKLASQAFLFCQRRKQRLAFRNNFCRLIREHWQTMGGLSREKRDKIRDQVRKEQGPQGDPFNKDTKFNLMIQAHLDQLDVAVFFDNWQDAYRAIEEIHQKMSYFKVMPKMETMVTYYNKLAQIFWVSNNFLFHAFALQRIFKNKEAEVVEKKLKKEDLQREAEEKQRLADKVILSVLCIPYWSQDRLTCVTPFTSDSQREKAERMTKLLKSQGAPPTRESLLSELNSNPHIFELAHPEVVNLYNVIERNVQPLTLAKKVDTLFSWLGENNLGDYTQQLKQVAAISVIISSSRVYSTLSLKALRDMCCFYENMDLESLLVTVARAPNSGVGLCIDHQSSSIRFEDANISSDILSSTLPNMRARLASVNRMLTKQVESDKEAQIIDSQQSLLLTRVNKLRDQERASVVQRKDIIERKKKRAEEEADRVKREKKEKIEEDKKKQLNEEKKKVEEDRQKRQQAEQEEAKKKKTEEQKKLIVHAFQKNQIAPAKKFKDMLETETCDADDLLEQGKRIMIEAKQKADQKRLKEWHAVHWLERAAREAEAPMIRDRHVRKLDEQKEAYETRKQNTMDQMKKDWEESSSHKQRLERVVPYMEDFYNSVMTLRHSDATLMKKALKHVEDEEVEKQLMEQAGRGASGPTEARGSGVVQQREEPKPNAAMEAGNWRSGPSAGSSSAAPAAPAAEEKKQAWRPGHKREEPAAPAAPATDAEGAPKKWVGASSRNRTGGAGGFPSSM